LITIVKDRPEYFKKDISEFYILPNEPNYIKVLKLEIMTLLADDNNSSQILKEFRSYLKYSDKKFVSTTIQSIGRIALAIPDETEGCINSLINLMSNTNETIVAESVIVIRHLLQPNPNEYEKIIKKLALMLFEIKVPVARACIVWMIGEYYTIIPKIGPDSLRMLAKSFMTEDDQVKLQILLLGTKLYIKRAKGAKLLFKYVLNLARYDMNYDIRDRARLIRILVFNPSENANTLKLRSKDLLVTKKLVPTFQSPQQDRSRFTLGSLSHLVNSTVYGYSPLPEYPETMNEEHIELRKKNEIKNQNANIALLESEKDESFYETNDENNDGEEDEKVPKKKSGWSSDEGFYSDEEPPGDELIDVGEKMEEELEEGMNDEKGEVSKKGEEKKRGCKRRRKR